MLLLAQIAQVSTTRAKMALCMLFPTLIALASASVLTPVVKVARRGERDVARHTTS